MSRFLVCHYAGSILYILLCKKREAAYILQQNKINMYERVGGHKVYAYVEDLPGDITPVDHVLDDAPIMLDEQAARTALGALGLRGACHKAKIETLSGGEPLGELLITFPSLFLMFLHVFSLLFSSPSLRKPFPESALWPKVDDSCPYPRMYAMFW